MKDSYLWDKTGERDAFVDGLVNKLSVMRYVRKQGSTMLAWLLPLMPAAVVTLVILNVLAPSRGTDAQPGTPHVEEHPAARIVVRTLPPATDVDPGTAVSCVPAVQPAPGEASRETVGTETPVAPDRR
jgi:hypothetical protein